MNGSSGRWPLWKRLFAFLTLFVATPTLVLVILSDFVLGNTLREEIGKAAAGKLRVAHGIETLLDDLVKNTGMRITLDPTFPSGPRRLADLMADGDLQYTFRRYLERLDDAVKTNDLFDSIDIVLEDTDYVLSSRSGVIAREDHPDAEWLIRVQGRGFQGNGEFLPPRVPAAGRLVLSYYFPFPPYLTERRGAVIVHILESEFSRLINSPANDGTISLIDADGLVVSDQDKTRVGKPWPGADPAKNLVTWFRPERGAWSYVGVSSLAAVNAHLDAVRLLSVAISLLLVAVGAAVSFALSRRFFHPLRRLIREVQQRLGADSEKEDNELGLLSGAFDVLLKRETQLFHDLQGEKLRRDQEALLRCFRGEPFELTLPLGPLCAASISVDGYRAFSSSHSPEQRDYLRSIVLTMAEKAFQPLVLRGAPTEKGIALLFSCQHEGSEFADAVEEGFEALSLEVKALLGTSVTLCVGSRGDGFNLPSSWDEAQALVRERFVHGPGRWFWAENPEVPAAAFFPAALERSLLVALEVCDRPGVKTALTDLESALSRRCGLGYDHASLILHQLVGGIVKHLLSTHTDLDAVLGVDRDLHRGLTEAETLPEALHWLGGVLGRVLDAQAHPSNPGYVETMLGFIQGQFHRDFSVDEVAAQAGLSYSHARKVFEDALGESIVDHTHALRIDEARRLLRETELPVEAVARSVGYSNGLGLHRHFKKSVGKTPGEYRTTHQQIG